LVGTGLSQFVFCPALFNPPQQEENVIRIENLETHLSGFNLYDINLSIERGEFFILMGPTGAGKTVLLEALAGLIPVRHGKIFIAGKDVTGLPPERRGIGIVYQD